MKEGLKDKIDLALKSIEDIDKNNFTILFYVIDTKGVPSGYVSYIYKLALYAKKAGYNVKMIYQGKEYVGVKEWMGDEYNEIEHINAQNGDLKVKPCDILIMPEMLHSVLNQTKKIPCKRVILCHNIDYITELIPSDMSWFDYNIKDVITLSETNKKYIYEHFPYMDIHLIPPYIESNFVGDKNSTRKLQVGFMCKHQRDIARSVYPFHWKYPRLQWANLIPLSDYSRNDLSDVLKETPIVVWIDDYTSFGYGILEAIKAGCIVIAKLPENTQDWMYDANGNLIDNVLWVNSIKDIPDAMNNVITAWMYDNIPSDLLLNKEKFDDLFTENVFTENVIKTIESLKSERRMEISNILNRLKEDNK